MDNKLDFNGNGGYEELLVSLKERIRTKQVQAALMVNRELILLYFEIGREITQRQAQYGWGERVLDRLARDLRSAFPGVEGFSRRNLYRMRTLYRVYENDFEFVPQAVAQIPWGHNALILEKVKTPEERRFYLQKTIEHGWSRNVLALQIESKLFERQGKSVTNFEQTLPSPQSELAQQLLKDPYNFDFLTLHEEALERDLERGLLQHLQKFLMELGAGFAFIASQYWLEVAGEDFYIDLLFYHVKLHCYVVIDLKMGEFKPEYAGKMNFYLSAVDDLLRTTLDAPSIGVILCKTKNGVMAEYALRNINKPIGVSEFLYTVEIPETLKGSLPTIEALESELNSMNPQTDEEDQPESTEET